MRFPMRIALWAFCLAAIVVPAAIVLYKYNSPKKSHKTVVNQPNKPFDPNEGGQHFLLTFPRSGTNIASCYVQSIAKKPIWFIDQPKPYCHANNRLNLQLDYSKTPIYRSHEAEPLQGLNKQGNKLLFLLRNYKECVHRKNHMKNGKHPSNEEFKNLFVDTHPSVKNYIDNLTTYDHWDPANRLLIFYEDLIANPLEQVEKILAFFGEPIPEFVNEEFLQSVSGEALEDYHEQHRKTGGSHSKGKDLEFHSKQIPTEYLVEIDERMETQYPHLWEAYLNRYKTKTPI